MKIISLGWGVQSFTLAAMVALGELDPVDFAIHADTTHEFSGTYEHAAKWTPWLEARGVKVVTVKTGDANFQNREGLNGKGTPPLYTKYSGDPSLVMEMELVWDDDGEEYLVPTGRMVQVTPNEEGVLNRSCTQRWKIAPMRRYIQDHRNGEPVEQWLGISLDEALRMKDSDVKYITHRWPLIEKRMTRHDCERWLIAHSLDVPPKSACVFCPYHNTAEWRRVKDSGNGDWHKAVEVDAAIRHARPPYQLFVHPSRRPLAEVDFRTAEEKGQLSLWDSECSGICGV